nr:MAG: zinc-binding loop region of homing endonuclease [Bacteriophage sp.]
MIKFKDINYPRRKEKEIIINLPNEIWKDVCDGYKVSNYGRVLSLAKTTIRGRKYDKILSASKKDNGYYTVSINGNNEYVHRLVAKAFIDNPNNLNEINHKDEDKSNNRVDNLEWCTKSYNVSYSKSKIIKIYNGTETIYNSVSEAAIKNNVSASAIYNCLYGKSKTCGGYEWIKR